MIEKQTIYKRLKTCEVLNIPQIKKLMLNDWNTLSKDARYYLTIPQMLVSGRDVRARVGTFNDPWGTSVSSKWTPTPFQFINTSLSDIVNQRAIEILNNAKNTNRSIVILWSGGIDSTVILTAFLKNLSLADHELLTVCLNTQSIADNPSFYFNFLSTNKKIKFLPATNFSFITDDFLSKNVLLHGDPGDGVYGPSTGMYRTFSNESKHLELWKNNLKGIYKILEPNIEIDQIVEPGFGPWFANIITRTLEESGQADYISTVADWYWWTYFNFKWSSMCCYPLFNGILSPDHRGLSDENFDFYSKNIFYHSSQFQNWSYSNLKELVGIDIFKTHKLKAREYIYEFDKNFQYFSRKRKTSTASPSLRHHKSSIIAHDQNFKPIFGGSPHAKQAVSMILKRYKESEEI